MVSTTNKSQITMGIICLMATSIQLQAAEFVVQTDLDSGGGQTIIEISPDVYTIDTLRSAVEQANNETNFPGPDIIRFDENIVISNPTSLFTTIILNQVGDVFNFQSRSSDSALPIDSSITIQGTLPGEPQLLIKLEADGLRHFQVNSGGKLRLNNLYIEDGETPFNISGRGGAVVVLDNGKLEINNCNIRFNQAMNGGALAFQTGSLDSLIQNSKISSNTASDENFGDFNFGQGGAIFADTGTNTVIIENSSLTGNYADSFGGAAYFNRPFYLLNITIGDNESLWHGGGIYADEDSDFTISNTVLNDNTSQMLGGAIFTSSLSAVASRIFNSTIANNEAEFTETRQTSGTGFSGGGGIFSLVADNLDIHNSIIATNKASGIANDVSATILSSSSFNLVGVSADLTGISNNTNGNLMGAFTSMPLDPGLILNGLSNSVQGLKSSSPAVNSGSDAQVIVAGLSTDIDGNNRIIGTAVDRGAHESDVLFYNGFE